MCSSDLEAQADGHQVPAKCVLDRWAVWQEGAEAMQVAHEARYVRLRGQRHASPQHLLAILVELELKV